MKKVCIAIVLVFIAFNAMAQNVFFIFSFPKGAMPVYWYADKLTKFGFRDGDNNIVVPAMYQNGWIYNYNGLMAVKKDGKWGYVDLDNNVVIPFEYDLAVRFAE